MLFKMIVLGIESSRMNWVPELRGSSQTRTGRCLEKRCIILPLNPRQMSFMLATENYIHAESVTLSHFGHPFIHIEQYVGTCIRVKALGLCRHRRRRYVGV